MKWPERDAHFIQQIYVVNCNSKDQTILRFILHYQVMKFRVKFNIKMQSDILITSRTHNPPNRIYYLQS